jgi:hypothetical protein
MRKMNDLITLAKQKLAAEIAEKKKTLDELAALREQNSQLDAMIESEIAQLSGNATPVIKPENSVTDHGKRYGQLLHGVLATLDSQGKSSVNDIAQATGRENTIRSSFPAYKRQGLIADTGDGKYEITEIGKKRLSEFKTET